MDSAEEKAVAKRGRPVSITPEARQQRILQAACEIFIEVGFIPATTAAIAARAKVSKRAIYEVFRDKTELFAAVVHAHRHLILDLPRPQEEALPVMATLYRIFRLDNGEEEARQREIILNLIIRESVLMPALSDYLYENEVLKSREKLAEWLTKEHETGRVFIEDSILYAGMLMDIVFGALLPRRRPHGAAERAQNTQEIKKRLHIAMYSALIKPPLQE